MTTKMNVVITIPGPMDSKELYRELSQHDASVSVTDLETEVYVKLTIDIRESVIEDVLQLCHKYGGKDLQVQAKEVVA